MCGTCERLPLTECACGDFEDGRAEIRREIDEGMSKDAILAAYVKEYGTDGLTVPPNTGALRAIYIFPLTAILAGGVGLGFMLKRWRTPHDEAPPAAPPPVASASRDEYDARLDEELKDLDD